ncbi:hypothetical protein Desaf_3259 [Desulfocurvibacter africanus subsp. africanus str. Walvis Bay]|uniref:Uncharacterized protein n=1 Tax=Desulfocurvibacter africanus subsp. africanus str. Walvis Bay TaxID=690850 RepID=F3Z3T4_DESAF|nr:hypothetical protein Desaf_3259 [Desulfocurvibacter africanus subsp. africanus str. Walvis Bay]
MPDSSEPIEELRKPEACNELPYKLAATSLPISRQPTSFRP